MHIYIVLATNQQDKMNLQLTITTFNSKSTTKLIETILKLILRVNSFLISDFKDHKNN